MPACLMLALASRKLEYPLIIDVPAWLPALACRESVSLTKRLLIEGEGELGETVIDQRAN